MFAWHVPDDGEPGVCRFPLLGLLAGAERGGCMGNPGRQHVAVGLPVGAHRIRKVPTNCIACALQPTWGFCWEKPAGILTSVPTHLVNLVKWTSHRRPGGGAGRWGLMCNEL